MTREESTAELEERLARFRTVSSTLCAAMRYALCVQEPPLTLRDREKEMDPVLCLNSVRYKTDKTVEHVEAFIEHVKKHSK